jgi:hypothetical protein
MRGGPHDPKAETGRGGSRAKAAEELAKTIERAYYSCFQIPFQLFSVAMPLRFVTGVGLKSVPQMDRMSSDPWLLSNDGPVRTMPT